LKIIVFTADAPVITGIDICSVYGPLPAATLKTTGPVIPQFNAATAAVKDWKFVPPVTSAELIVYVPPGRGGLTTTWTGTDVWVLPLQVTAQRYHVVAVGFTVKAANEELLLISVYVPPEVEELCQT